MIPGFYRTNLKDLNSSTKTSEGVVLERESYIVQVGFLSFIFFLTFKKSTFMFIINNLWALAMTLI